jgi:hypothetical protein
MPSLYSITWYDALQEFKTQMRNPQMQDSTDEDFKEKRMCSVPKLTDFV